MKLVYSEPSARFQSREVSPASGWMVPEIGDEGLREVIHRNYRIVYIHLPDEDRIEVLTVFHASRQSGLPPGE